MNRMAVISTVAVVLLAAVGARADMTALDELIDACTDCPPGQTGAPSPCRSASLPQRHLDLASLHRPVTSSLEWTAFVDTDGHTRPAEILTDQQNSLQLCLYSLIGLALCKSSYWVKRPSLNFAPEWSCCGCPHAGVARGGLCMVAIGTPEHSAGARELLAPRYRRKTSVSLWRTSQFTPDVMAS